GFHTGGGELFPVFDKLFPRAAGPCETSVFVKIPAVKHQDGSELVPYDVNLALPGPRRRCGSRVEVVDLIADQVVERYKADVAAFDKLAHPADLDVGDIRSADACDQGGEQPVVHLLIRERADVDRYIRVDLFKLLRHRLVPLVAVVGEAPKLQGLGCGYDRESDEEDQKPHKRPSSGLQFHPSCLNTGGRFANVCQDSHRCRVFLASYPVSKASLSTPFLPSHFPGARFRKMIPPNK